ncbi:TerD family protein [Nocardia sp. NPDC050413]|uniref:TerD family protein n=1 Tax=Nocardia sp. NPDC050413 TaxID=3155784 RepID=UPI0033DDF3AB
MITLEKEDGPADLAGITKLSVGVSWDPSAGSSGGLLGMARRKRGVDLDLVAVLMQGGEPLRFAGLDSLDPIGTGAVVHTGDEQTGAASGDDETVNVVFGDIPAAIDSIVFIAAAFKKGSSFEKANNVSFKIYDATGSDSQQVADIGPRCWAPRTPTRSRERSAADPSGNWRSSTEKARSSRAICKPCCASPSGNHAVLFRLSHNLFQMSPTVAGRKPYSRTC